MHTSKIYIPAKEFKAPILMEPRQTIQQNHSPKPVVKTVMLPRRIKIQKPTSTSTIESTKEPAAKTSSTSSEANSEHYNELQRFLETQCYEIGKN